MESTREPKKAFPLLAPRSGTVVAKQALAGMYVDASTELYFVSDLSRVWVVIDLYEVDVPLVKVGDKARRSIQGLPGPPRESVQRPKTVSQEEAARRLEIGPSRLGGSSTRASCQQRRSSRSPRGRSPPRHSKRKPFGLRRNA